MSVSGDPLPSDSAGRACVRPVFRRCQSQTLRHGTVLLQRHAPGGCTGGIPRLHQEEAFRLDDTAERQEMLAFAKWMVESQNLLDWIRLTQAEQGAWKEESAAE